MKTIFKNILLFAIVLATSISCSNDVLDENPPHILSGETLYTNLAGFEAGLNGLYNIARHHRWQSEKNRTLAERNRQYVEQLQTWKYLLQMGRHQQPGK